MSERHSTRVVYPNQEGVEYRPVIGWSDYLVGSDGTVWSKKQNGIVVNPRPWRLLAVCRDNYGYGKVSLCKDGKPALKRISHLILEAFVGPCPEGMEACHGPNGKFDDSLVNLSWGTRTKNMNDKRRDGTHQNGDAHPHSKLTSDAVLDIRARWSSGGVTMKSLAAEYGVDIVTVHDVIHRKTWFHI